MPHTRAVKKCKNRAAHLKYLNQKVLHRPDCWAWSAGRRPTIISHDSHPPFITYAIRILIKRGRCAINTQKLIKRIQQFSSISEGEFSKFLISKRTHFKIQPREFRNAEFGQWMCLAWAESKHELSISWAIYLQVMKPFRVFIPPIRFSWWHIWQ